jgi:hypothetical protein
MELDEEWAGDNLEETKIHSKFGYETDSVELDQMVGIAIRSR